MNHRVVRIGGFKTEPEHLLITIPPGVDPDVLKEAIQEVLSKIEKESK